MLRLIVRKKNVISNTLTGIAARKERKKAGLSLRMLAPSLGFSSTYLLFLEKGKANWSESLVKKFNDVLAKQFRDKLAKEL